MSQLCYEPIIYFSEMKKKKSRIAESKVYCILKFLVYSLISSGLVLLKNYTKIKPIFPV